MKLTIAYTLANRGRHIDSFVSYTSEFLDNHEDIILFIDECDSRDKAIGLDGRKIFEEIKRRTKRDDLKYYVPEDENIGIAFIASEKVKVENIDHTQINRGDLVAPQGKSERYKHYRLCLEAKFNERGFFFVVQHNSAFIRPIRRFHQSLTAMRILNRNKGKMSFLIRDQNTFIPGEGQLEKVLRRKNKIYSLTDGVRRKYRIENLEGDSGGLNGFATKLIKKGIPQFIDKHIITLGDKIESICTLQQCIDEKRFEYRSFHHDIDYMDHGMLYTIIEF